MLIKIIIILMLITIVGSLFSALVFLYRDRDRNSTRMVRALTWRISLSITLFILLLVGFKTGLIPPLGLRSY